MLIQKSPPLHLTYCLNVHPGEDLASVRESLERWAARVKRRICPGEPFGLGLRLGYRAANELLQGKELDSFQRLLDRHDMYVFTINGFPYGDFHGTSVKDRVYAPDWRDPARREYTVTLARILATLLPEGVTGSISTVPASFKPWIHNEADVKAMTANLTTCVEEVAGICDLQNRRMVIALEPEPGCWIETTAEAVRFFSEHLPESTRPWLGLCLDTCHLAVQWEDPVESLVMVRQAGIVVGKVQLSAAVETNSADVLEKLRDPVYLHQTRVRTTDHADQVYMDIPDTLVSGARARIHFHVPLHLEGGVGWTSTATSLSSEFFRALRLGMTEHVEVETYTFNVLPAAWKRSALDESLARDLEWVRQRMLA